MEKVLKKYKTREDFVYVSINLKKFIYTFYEFMLNAVNCQPKVVLGNCSSPAYPARLFFMLEQECFDLQFKTFSYGNLKTLFQT